MDWALQRITYVEILAQLLVAIMILTPLAVVVILAALRNQPAQIPEALILAAGAVIGFYFGSRAAGQATREQMNGAIKK